MKLKFISCLFLFVSFVPPFQARAASPFVAVFVDDATEKELGPFPFDRSQYAKALKALRQAGAKGVIVKFFLDQAKPGPGDDQLAAEIKLLPVLLQARLDPKEPKPNPVPARFDRSGTIKGDVGSLISAESGWTPLEKFSGNAADIGFLHIAYKDDLLKIPMVFRYQKAVFPGLELAGVEMALGQASQMELGKNLSLAGHSLPLNRSGTITVQLPLKDTLDPLSFRDVLHGAFDPKRVAGKIVVLGFDAKETPLVPTSLGSIGIHRLFFYTLESLYQQLLAH